MYVDSKYVLLSKLPTDVISYIEDYATHPFLEARHSHSDAANNYIHETCSELIHYNHTRLLSLFCSRHKSHIMIETWPNSYTADCQEQFLDNTYEDLQRYQNILSNMIEVKEGIASLKQRCKRCPHPLKKIYSNSIWISCKVYKQYNSIYSHDEYMYESE